MLLKPKYGRFRNDSVTSCDDLMQSLAMSSKVVPSTTSSLPSVDPSPMVPSSSEATSSCLEGEQDATTTFCMLIPKMPQWKFSNTRLSRSSSSSGSGSSKDSGKTAVTPQTPTSSPHRAVNGMTAASMAAVLNACDPVCATSCSLQAFRGQRAAVSSVIQGGHGFATPESSQAVCSQLIATAGSGEISGTSRSGMSRRTRVEGIWLGEEDFTQKGSFIHKPSQGWLHPDKKIAGPGASYIVKYNE